MWMVDDFINLEGRSPKNYNEIIDWVNKINISEFGGYSDWRIPSIREYDAVFDSRLNRMGFILSKTHEWLNQIKSSIPVGYPIVFKNGGGYWFWSNEEDNRCTALTILSKPCYRIFNFRDRMVSSRTGFEGNKYISSVRLVRNSS